ncbi:tetratricopeptide repeat protein [Alloacidobacterium dinghuense]|nr:tetratricopeptide repeat protein [Alloacidobacterium dinghuense]
MEDRPSSVGFIMPLRRNPLGICLCFTVFSVATHGAQTGNSKSVKTGSLQQHYDAAQEFQRTGKLSEAAEQYRAFLADALGKLAIGYGLAQDYSNAAPLFDEALALDSDSRSLLLDYARTAFMLGEFAHAKTLATEYIRKYTGDREQLAQAHQVLGRTLLKLNQDQEARKELEAAVALDPTFANGYDLAVACLDLEDEKCAVQIFGEMQASFGDTSEIHMAFGRAYGDSDFQSRAAAEFKRAIEENPRLPSAHYSLAAILLATGGDESHMEAAETDLKKELIISPKDSKTYAALGKIAVNRKKYSEAETYLQKAISLDPQNPDAYLYLGQMYFEANRPAEAETALRQCIRLTADVSRNRYQVQNAHFLLGRLLMQKGQHDAAHAEMETARVLANKTLTQDKDKLAGLLDASDVHDVQAPKSEAGVSLTASNLDPLAMQKVEAMKEQVRPAVADSYNNLGALAATNSDYSGAVTYFKRAAAWNPSLEGLDYNWARAAFAGSQFADAILPVSRYLKSYPDDNGARSVLAISQFMTGDYHGCIETLQPVIGKADLVPQVEYAYAESMVRTGQVDSGRERLEALEKAHPEISEVHRFLGETLWHQGVKQRAIEELRTAIQLSPRDADSRFDLGKMELEGGDIAASIPALESAVKLSPNSEKFHQALAEAYTAARRPADARKEMEACELLRTRAQNGAAPHRTDAPEQ